LQTNIKQGGLFVNIKNSKPGTPQGPGGPLNKGNPSQSRKPLHNETTPLFKRFTIDHTNDIINMLFSVRNSFEVILFLVET
jgi:hypothetical protein